tara:strand:+ start:3788 stop:4306 length:519 start_codon:yes stop_codon:yes gene_type:complete
MNFIIGEQVSILNETGSYKVIGIESAYLVLEDEHGFDRRIPHRMIAKSKPVITRNVVRKDQDKELLEGGRKRKEMVPCIDLHIESLLDVDYHMSAFDKLNLQVKTFKEFININLSKRKKKVLVIHGIGEGRLKSEIASLLNRPGYDMHDANYSPVGVGASYIEITLSRADPL